MMTVIESPAKEWENEADAFEVRENKSKKKKWKLPFRKRKGEKKEKLVLTKEQKKKRRKRFLIGGLAVVILAVLILPRMFAGNTLPTVVVISAQKGNVSQTITGSGTVHSELETTYFSPVGATVDNCKLSVGDTVEKGDVLLTYDANELENLYQQASLTGSAGTYGYQDAITRDNENISEYNRSTHDIGILEQQVEDWTNSVEHLNDRIAEYSGKQAEAAQTLAAKQEILAQAQQEQIAAQKNLETARAELEAAQSEQPADQSKVEAAQEKVSAAESALNTVNSQVEAAEKNVKKEQDNLKQVSGKLSDYQNRLNSASKELAKFNENLVKQEGIQASSDASRLTGAARSQLAANENLNQLNTSITKDQVEQGRRGIIAEYSGVVTAVNAIEGGPAIQGEALFTIASNESVSVEMNITRYDLEKMEEGQKATITTVGREYTGTVERLSHLAQQNDKGTPVVKAQVKFDEPDENVYLGMEANVTVSGMEAKDVIVVPVEAVNTGRDGSFCYVVEDGVVVKRIVETGISSDTMTEIISGLKVGDSVIRKGTEMVEEGMQVIAVEE